MICLFDKSETNFAGNGICVLSPTVCTVTEVAGGNYELHMEHPMDDDGKFLLLQEEMIIRAPVPRRVIPQITLPEVKIWRTTESADVYSVLPVFKKAEVDPVIKRIRNDPSTYAWKQTMAYNTGALVTYSGKVYKALMFNFAVIPTSTSAVWAYVAPVVDSGGGYYTSGTVIETVPANAMISKLADYDATYMQIRTQNSNVGYIERDKCIETTSTTSGEVIPSRTITEQLFRIYKVQGEDDTHTVTVEAQHISYDFRGNSLYDCKLTDADPMTAIAILQGNLIVPDERLIVCDIEGKKVSEDWSFRNPISALLDPNSGLLGILGGSLIRDNQDIFILDDSEPSEGITIQYGVNMLGVKWSKNIENVVTRVLPRANNGTNGYIYIDNLYVDSDAIDDYAFPRIEVLDCAYTIGEEYEKPDGTKETWTEANVKQRMQEDAEERFTKDKADIPEITLEVQFLLLGDTEEYKQYKGLQSVSLYDVITVKTGKSGVTAQAQVSEYEYNCLTLMYNSIRVGDVSSFHQRVPGFMVVRNSITYDKLSEDLIARIRSGNASGSTDSWSQGGTTKAGAVKIITDVIDNLTSTRTDAALSANQGRVLNDLIAIKSYEDYEFTGMSFTAGTPGTRGNQFVYTPSKTPVAVCVVHVADSSLFIPFAFISGGKVYVNAYRSVTTPMTGNRTTVRIFYDS